MNCNYFLTWSFLVNYLEIVITELLDDFCDIGY